MIIYPLLGFGLIHVSKSGTRRAQNRCMPCLCCTCIRASCVAVAAYCRRIDSNQDTHCWLHKKPAAMKSPWIMYYSESCLYIQMSILWGDPGTWVDSIPNFDAIGNRLTSIQKAQVFLVFFCFLVLFCFCFSDNGRVRSMHPYMNHKTVRRSCEPLGPLS